jgi:hypothetical protein
VLSLYLLSAVGLAVFFIFCATPQLGENTTSIRKNNYF